MIQPTRSFKITVEYLADTQLLPPFEAGECFRLFTFTGNDWTDEKVTLFHYDSHFQRFIVTVPSRTPDEEVVKVLEQLNPNYKIQIFGGGYDGDDFVHDRRTLLAAVVNPEGIATLRIPEPIKYQ